MTLLPRSIPHECTGSCCHQCRAKMRRRILGQISSGFGMTAASMPAKPTLFPIASTFGVTRTRPVRYSLQPATIWYEVRRWPTTTVRTWCCSLVPLVPLTGIGQWTQHALGYGSFRLGIYAARTRCITSWCQAAMLEREGRRDSHWRQPWTSDSLALGSEIKIRNHPIGRATDIFPCSGCFIAGLSKWAICTIRVVRNFPYHKPSQDLWVHPLRGHLGYGSMSYNLGNVGICVWYLLFYGGAVL